MLLEGKRIAFGRK